MRSVMLVLLLWSITLAAFAKNAPRAEKVTAEQLEQLLAASHDRSDGELAQQILQLELTERLSTAHLLRLQADLPGNRSRDALLAVADLSAFAPPPLAEISESARPDAGALSQMMVKIANYVITTIHELPNFITTRDTTSFENRPHEDTYQDTLYSPARLNRGNESSLPLHIVGNSIVTVTYRDNQEVVNEGTPKSKVPSTQVHGLVTAGEFGPILKILITDAMKGEIFWSRWERDAGDTEAVFRYEVPKDKSHYIVQVCCAADSSSNGVPGAEASYSHVVRERAGYHGEIAFHPASGTIHRISLTADMPQYDLISRAGVVVEYGPVDISGKTYNCPLRSVSLLTTHTTQPPDGAPAVLVGQGPTKTFLNDVSFEHYRRFGAQIRILPGLRAAPDGEQLPSASAGATPEQR